MSVLVNKKKLSKIRQQILQERYITTELEMEMRDRQTIRIILLFFVSYCSTAIFLLMIFPFLTSKEFAMPVYTQLPWTKYVVELFINKFYWFSLIISYSLHSHPSYEINYAVCFYYASISMFVFCGNIFRFFPASRLKFFDFLQLSMVFSWWLYFTAPLK